MARRIFIFIILTSILSYAGWEKLNSNTSEWLTGVYFVDENYGFVVGTNGTVLKTTDGGDTWLNISIEKKEWLTSVFFIDKDKGFTVGTNALVASTIDGGATWQYSYLQYQLNFHEVFFIDGLNGWITGGTIDGGSIILKTTDSGSNWLYVTGNVGSELLGIKFNSSGEGYAVGRNGTILKSIDGGYDWLESSSGDYVFEDVCFACNKIWITGDHGLYQNLFDGGDSWNIFPKISDDHLFKAAFIDEEHGIIVGGYGSGDYSESSIIMETSDGGSNWKLTQEPSWSKLYSVSMPSKERAFAVGYNGTILRYGPNVVSVDKINKIPSEFILSQNFPNPFNPTTKIQYLIPVETTRRVVSTSLKVYDVLGREVATLVNEDKSPGTYEVEFNGSKLSSGIYFYKISFGNLLQGSSKSFVQTKKMLLIK